MNLLAAVVAAVLGANAAAEPLESAVAGLASSARAAGAKRVAVAEFQGAAPGGLDGARAAAGVAALLARDGRVTPVLPGGARAAADAVVVGTLIMGGDRARLLMRLVDARSGVILAAADAEVSEAARADPRVRLFDRARRLLDGVPPVPGAERREAEDRLQGVLESVGGSEARAAAALALGRLGSGRALAALSRAAEDPDAGVRSAAALALGLSRDPAGAARLAWIARSDSDAGVRDAAALALARR